MYEDWTQIMIQKFTKNLIHVIFFHDTLSPATSFTCADYSIR